MCVSAKRTGRFIHLRTIPHRFLHFKPKGEKGGEGGGGERIQDQFQTSVYTAVIVTLTCRMPYSKLTGGGTCKKARNVVATCLLPAKVICTSGFERSFLF